LSHYGRSAHLLRVHHPSVQRLQIAIIEMVLETIIYEIMVSEFIQPDAHAVVAYPGSAPTARPSPVHRRRDSSPTSHSLLHQVAPFQSI